MFVDSVFGPVYQKNLKLRVYLTTFWGYRSYWPSRFLIKFYEGKIFVDHQRNL